MRRVLSLFVVVFIVIMFPVQAIATAPQTVSGSCGQTTTWKFDGNTLTICGKGSVDSAYPSPWDEYKNQIIKVVIEEGITEIGDCIFINHSNLVEVQFPKSLICIGGQVFQGCDKIENFSIPENVAVIGNPGTYRSAATTFSCAALKNIDVVSENKHFYSVDGVLFDSANKILLCYPQARAYEIYVVPDGIREIASGAFWFSALEKIRLPESIEAIGDSAFSGTKLTTIKIPNAVDEIQRSTFSNCDYLKTITIPKSVQVIGRDAFAACDALEEVVFFGSDCVISNVTSTIPHNTILRGYINSDAQTYALTYGYKFVDIQNNTVYNYDAGNEGLLALLPSDISVSCPVFNRVVEGENTIGGYQPTLVFEADPGNTTYQKMFAFVKEMIADCTTDRQKAYKIFCWVNDNMAYEYARFGVGETAAGIYQLWKDRVSNCEGFTQLNNFLLYLAGIPNAVATSIDHCWTVALLDGEWCMIDATNRVFDKAPNDYADIRNIFFGVDDVLVCVVDDMTGVKLASYGLDVCDNDTYQEITIPDYITYIYDSTFRYRDYGLGKPGVVICGTVGSYAQTYVDANLPGYIINYKGDQFVASIKKESDKPVHTHDLQVVPYKAATHALVGNVEHYICAGCKAVFEDGSAKNELAKDKITIPAEGHQYKDYNSDLTKHWLTCSCSKMQNAEEHSWSQWAVVTEPNAMEPGVECRSCDICGCEEQREMLCTEQESVGNDIDDSNAVDSEEFTQPVKELEETSDKTNIVEETKGYVPESTDIVSSEDNNNSDITSVKGKSAMRFVIGGFLMVAIGLVTMFVARKKR